MSSTTCHDTNCLDHNQSSGCCDLLYVGQRIRRRGIAVIDLTEPGIGCRQCHCKLENNDSFFLVKCGCAICGKCAKLSSMEGVCKIPGHSSRPQSIMRLFYQDTCAICYEEYEQLVAVKLCGHLFCKECLRGAVKAQCQPSAAHEDRRNATCPLCRTNIGAGLNDLAQWTKRIKFGYLCHEAARDV